MIRNQRGITLGSLIIYIIVTTIVIVTLTTITMFFSNQLSESTGENLDLTEIDKFNIAFLKEVKKTNNDVSAISEDETSILFTLGNTYSFVEDAIYLNSSIKIAENIEACTFYQSEQDGKKIVIVTIILNDTTYTRKFVLNNKANTSEFVNELDYTYYPDSIT